MRLISRLSFSFSKIEVPSVDLTRYLRAQPGWQDDCKQVSEILRKYGLIYVKDYRVDPSQNEGFIDMMEQYFQLRSSQYDRGLRNIDVITTSSKAIGLNHSYGSKFINYKEAKDKLKPPHQSLTPDEPTADPTWRLRWILDHHENINPPEFPHFNSCITAWGNSLKNCSLVVSEMAALGFGLEKSTFTEKIGKGGKGEFYVAPTGIDLRKTVPGQMLTGFHRDFDLLTIHGKSRYNGLYAWLNTGEKFVVDIPEGHLLVQAGKQMEWLTGGQIMAGFHQVLHNQLVEQKKQAVVAAGKLPWRIASVMFCQVEGHQSIRPLPAFRSKEVEQLYPDITADEYLSEEIRTITQNTV